MMFFAHAEDAAFYVLPLLLVGAMVLRFVLRRELR